ncbi:MAG: hypothetical protein K2J28_02630 [Duncaniella sp.]|nr:hypothetical protein [Duncaniella sp.]
MRQLLLSLSLLVALPTFAVRKMANVVCFVKFADQTENEWQHPQDYYAAMFNDDSEGANSVKNYFTDMSYGAMEWNSVIVPLVYVDSHPRGYYCKQTSINPDGYTNTLFASMREQTMLKSMCEFIESSLPEDAEIDCDDDGVVDNLTVIINGNSEISSSNNLWPANNKCVWAAAYLRGKKIDYYLKVFDKANGYKSLIPQELNTGVLCHEMMHTLDAYDLYSNGNLDPVGVWDLMSDNQKTPQGLSAYVRHTYGRSFGNWIPKIEELSEPGRYQLRPLDSQTPDGVTFKIVPDKKKSEYFMVEYRDKSTLWDKSLPAAGMLVYRIDPSRSGNLNASKFEMYVFRPGGSTESAGLLAKAPLGEATGRTSFGAEGDSDYPFYSDGTRAQFSITDVVTTADGIEFTLGFADSAISDVFTDMDELTYDRESGEIVAPGTVKVEVFAISGIRIESVKDAPRGVYFVHAHYPDGNVRTLKFAK